MKKGKAAKKVVIAVVTAVAVGGVSVGGYYGIRQAQKTTVKVYPVSDFTSGYWGDSMNMEGQITSTASLNIYLSEKLRAFHNNFPGIRLRISNHSTPQALQAVKNGEVDFAIISTPAEVEPGLKLVELKSFYEVLVGGRTFTALASQSLTLKELSNYPLISLSDESMTRSFYRQFFLDHDAVLRPDTEAATTDQMLTLVKSELGLAFVPEPMAKDLLARGELVQLHLQEIIPTRSICLVYDHHRPLNTAARKFQQMMTKADSPRPAASKQTESISFISQ